MIVINFILPLTLSMFYAMISKFINQFYLSSSYYFIIEKVIVINVLLPLSENYGSRIISLDFNFEITPLNTFYFIFSFNFYPIYFN